MRDICTNQVDLIRTKGMHTASNQQSALAFQNQRELYFFMPVKVRIEIWHLIFLEQDSFLLGSGYCKRKDFHTQALGILQRRLSYKKLTLANNIIILAC